MAPWVNDLACLYALPVRSPVHGLSIPHWCRSQIRLRLSFWPWEIPHVLGASKKGKMADKYHCNVKFEGKILKFLFWGGGESYTSGIWKFLSQGLNLSHSFDLCQSCSNTRSLTHCTTIGTPKVSIFNKSSKLQYCSNNYFIYLFIYLFIVFLLFLWAAPAAYGGSLPRLGVQS